MGAVGDDSDGGDTEPSAPDVDTVIFLFEICIPFSPVIKLIESITFL